MIHTIIIPLFSPVIMSSAEARGAVCVIACIFTRLLAACAFAIIETYREVRLMRPACWWPVNPAALLSPNGGRFVPKVLTFSLVDRTIETKLMDILPRLPWCLLSINHCLLIAMPCSHLVGYGTAMAATHAGSRRRASKLSSSSSSLLTMPIRAGIRKTCCRSRGLCYIVLWRVIRVF
jgi:hypothetical protein